MPITPKFPHQSIILSSARVTCKLSNSQVVKALGLSRTTYSHWEKGRRKIPSIYLGRVSRILRVNAEVIKTAIRKDLSGSI
ncbi:MAG: helix-turn-helix transcriptional regulator [Halobacteriovoraceae bacterium]|jgi:DNA-binding XRE family transcriptional regulator|nr:helix-turn-helix transcriptional regulator [Halobacteriovoraceae bacterium]